MTESNSGGIANSDNSALSITVIEGWRTEQIADELVALGWNGSFDEFMEAAQSYPSENFSFLADRPEGASLEGYLYPDTYNFTPDSSPNEILESMLNNFDAKIPQDMRDRAAEMGLSLYQVMIFASLVEREAAVSEERPIIADIYQKRYMEGWRLDADPTVQYALGTQDDWWPELTGDDLFADSPYNTYQVQGLPPGPIANPGYSSVRAVLFPADSPYYFFFAKGDGSGYHLFATTLDEQQQNIDLRCRRCQRTSCRQRSLRGHLIDGGNPSSPLGRHWRSGRALHLACHAAAGARCAGNSCDLRALAYAAERAFGTHRLIAGRRCAWSQRHRAA